jgi:hypothetical protein
LSGARPPTLYPATAGGSGGSLHPHTPRHWRAQTCREVQRFRPRAGLASRPVSLLWTVPVVAAALATGFVAARARALEDATVDLAIEIRRLRELRPRLAGVRAAVRDARERASDLRRRHPLAPEDDIN